MFLISNGVSNKQGLYDPQFEHDSCGVGFVVDVKGKKSNNIVSAGLEVLERLTHRGAVGADPKTGDGAGILIQIPHEFFKKVAKESKISLPNQGEYGTGLVFLPQDELERKFCKDEFEKFIKQEGQTLLGWRSVPVDSSVIGETARETEPVIEQVFIGNCCHRGDAINRVPTVTNAPTVNDDMAFERKLYLIRRQVENAIKSSSIKQKSCFYVTNLSCRTFSYKGLLMPYQVKAFFLDLQDKDVKSCLALVHSRYSTNTFPTWDLSQPFRFLAHNGEINTLRGNVNWMKAKEGLLQSELFGDDIEKIKSIIVPGGSDSAMLDNVLEMISLSGKSLPHTLMMLIPPAWEHNDLMDQKVRDFYEYHACFMEPWDGPAAIAVTDGTRIGALLDRNGLRPARYIITKKGFVVMASEMGVLDIDPSDIEVSGRLEPGKIFFIDTEEGRIIDDNEIKNTVAGSKPYGKWLKDNLADIDGLSPNEGGIAQSRLHSGDNILSTLKAFGYTREDFKVIINSMAETGKEPIGSMGNDTPLALLSQKPQLLYNYFKQLFAQVTNPPIDPIREEIVMSLQTYIGSQKNMLSETESHCHKLKVKHPILKDEDLNKIKNINENGFKTKTISTLFKVSPDEGGIPQSRLHLTDGFTQAIDKICHDAEFAIDEGFSFIILSDRGFNKEKAALPALVAIGAVHQHLVSKFKRTQIGVILESAEPREVHHFGLLFGYGADCINPYLVYASIVDLIDKKEIKLDKDKAIFNYIDAVEHGILKILSKMGISTLNSYRGAQIFEALGIADDVIEKCFTGTTSRIGGAGFDIIAKETILRHKSAFEGELSTSLFLATGGVYQWKKDGETHLWNPQSISTLQHATRTGDYNKYKEFAGLINDQSKSPVTLRSLLKFKDAKTISIDAVESEKLIYKRLATGAMSFGSISRAAHETLAFAMNKLGGRSNTGEGGEDPSRFTPLPNGDSARSAIKQVASGRFGVTTNYLINADEIQIKIAQGAKPGEGGQLPGHKVSAIIAKTRYTTLGVTLISPPPHHDIYSIEDLAQLIYDLKNTNPQARISVKLVSEIGVGTVAAGVAKGHADMILISGGDGGTGASPISSIKHAGAYWELGISETHQTLVLNNLRGRVRLQTDGQMRTGRDIAIAALLGAEEYGFCTAALIVMGCVMLRHCHLNNCSLGVATQDELLSQRFMGRVDEVINYFGFVVRELRGIMAELGFRTMDEMIGRTEFLELNSSILPWKAKDIDFSKILYKPKMPASVATRCVIVQDHNIDKVLDRELIKLAKPALEKSQVVKEELEIKNVNRTTGAMLSGEVCKRYGESGLPTDTINFKFKGVSGQSFGAFLARGVTFELSGLANDYVGKGMSGGKIIIYPDPKVTYKAENNIMMGNTTFYGAIAGEAYIRGVAGERFCIRNSGVNAVVEGVGDHGCEYMTGGHVVILGKTGRNFGAGMSGGVAYVYDEDKTFNKMCNMEMIELEELSKEDLTVIRDMLHNHFRYTKSSVAKRIVDDFGAESKKFLKVMPKEYKRILKQMEEPKKTGEVSDG